MEAMSGLDELLAIREIELLKARRDRALDAKDWSTYEALHAADHYSHNDGAPRWNSAAETTAAVSRMLEGIVTIHHSHTPEITFESSTRASGIWAMEDQLYWKQGDDEHWLHGFGHYYETYEKRDGQWLFTSRRLQRLHVVESPGAVFGPAPQSGAEAGAEA